MVADFELELQLVCKTAVVAEGWGSACLRCDPQDPKIQPGPWMIDAQAPLPTKSCGTRSTIFSQVTARATSPPAPGTGVRCSPTWNAPNAPPPPGMPSPASPGSCAPAPKLQWKGVEQSSRKGHSSARSYLDGALKVSADVVDGRGAPGLGGQVAEKSPHPSYVGTHEMGLATKASVAWGSISAYTPPRIEPPQLCTASARCCAGTPRPSSILNSQP